jgi:acyl-CoA thioesterase-2
MSLEELMGLLRLEAAGDGPAADGIRHFTGRSQRQPDDRVFGGLLLAQALVAAGRTVSPSFRPLSLQAEFLAGVPVGPCLHWEAEPLVLGKGMSALRSTLRSASGTPLFTATSRWGTLREDLPSHSVQEPRAVPRPEDLPDLHERFGSGTGIPLWWRMRRPLAFRHVETPAYGEPVHPRQDHQSAWVRARGVVPEDGVLRAALVAYASDMSLVEPVFRACGSARHRPGSRILSLTHTMVLHDVPDLSHWHQFDVRAHRMSHGRALGLGEFFDAAGRHVASVSQLAAVKLG